MRKEIITRIIVWIVTIVIILLGGYAVKEFVIDRPVEPEAPSVEYTLDTNAFGGVAIYNETIDLSKLTITKTENGVTTEIPVDASMVTTPVDTTRVGASMLKLSYEGQEFSVPVTVKYKIQFATSDGVFETIYTLNSSELDKIEAPEKEGYTFSGWSTEIPDILFNNMDLVATYEAIIPSLTTIEATYGDALAGIKLPENAAGAWKLDYAEGTVGNAGRRTFDVSFIENGTNKVLKTAKLIVNVARRAVKIDVFADFTYNGKRQEPTYKTDIDVKISAWWDGNKNYTDAGEYSYHFEVDDSNYVGEAKGTYTIKPAVVTVEIKDAQIFANEALPKIEYQISGFEGMSQEQLAEFVGLTIVYPQSVVVGEHKITAKASNPSIQLEVKDGTLKVIQATLEGIGDPVLLSKVATYEDLIGSIGFEMHPNGKWIWETPDAAVGTVGKQKHIAIFVPSNSAYEQIKCEVEITVVPKPMVIEVVGNTTFDYDGTDHNLSLVVKDEAGNLYNNLEVVGNDLCKKAGTYTITLTLADPNYSATKVVTLTINKVDPETDFTQVFTAVWSATLKLSDVKLPTGYAWANPDKRIETAGTASYAVIFTPADTENYNLVTGEFKLEVAKATAKIENAKENYTFTYNGNVHTITGVTASNGGMLVYTFEDGTLFTGVTNAGEYTVIITLPESENYKAAEATTTITILPADNEEDRVKVVQNAIFGDSITKVELPTSNIGTWSIEGEHTTVGNAGTNYFWAIFESATDNYNDKRVKIEVIVAKQVVRTPTAPNATSIYDSTIKYSGLTGEAGVYTVEIDGAINVGTYHAELKLVDPSNYAWDYVGNTNEITKVEYSIKKATITFENKPEIQEEWTFTPGQTIPLPDFGVDQSFVPAEDIYFEYQYSADGGRTWTEWTLWTEATAVATWSFRSTASAPSQAGMYRVRAVVVGTDNYDQITTSNENIVEFVIHKAEVVVPNYTTQYPYQGVGVAIKADIPTSERYNIKWTAGTYVGDTCYATLTLTDSVNYKWVEKEGEDGTYGHSNPIQLNYEIVKASPELSGLTAPNIIFGNQPAPSVSGNKFGIKVTYTYATAEDGEYSEEKPTAAGTYWVKAAFVGNQNILAQTIGPVSFKIEKADAKIQNAKDSYTFDYNGNVHTIPTNVKASNGVTLVYTYEGGNTPFVGVTNAGTYKVTITLPETENYNGDSVTVTVIVNPAKNNDYLNPSYSATYGDSITKLEEQLPTTNETGAWSIDTTQTTVGDAGTQTFVAVFTPYEQYKNNYATRTETITVIVAKAVIVPSIPDKTYNGDYQTSGLNDSRYTVTEIDNGEGVKKGGKNVGTYTVTLTLTADAAKNYAWNNADNQNLEIEVSYTIVKEETLSFNNAISIEGWIYGKYNETTNAYTTVVSNKDFANALIKYQYAIWNTTTAKWSDWTDWADPAGFNAGSYKIRAIIVGTDNYNQVVSNEKEFVVEKAGVIVPNYTTQYPYQGPDTEIEANIPASDLYSIQFNSGTDVGSSYYATLTLNNTTNYKWVEEEGVDGIYGHSNAIRLNYEIVKASPELSGLTVPNVTFGNKPNPSVSGNKFDVVVSYQYYKDADCTESIVITETTPVGTYYVKATFGGNQNILAQTIGPVSFKIEKADAKIQNAKDSYTFDYDGRVHTLPTNIKASNGVTLVYTYEGGNTLFEGVTNAGTYKVTITLPETDNYKGDSVTVTVLVNPAKNTDYLKPSYSATYGDSITELEKQLPTTNQTGAWSIDTTQATVGDAGTQTFVAVFTPYEQYKNNYATRTENITVIVAKAVIVPSIPNKTYNGDYQTSGLNDSRYTVTEVDNGEGVKKGGKNVGTYEVTLTLTAEAFKNYAWNNVENQNLEIEVSYTIVKEETLSFNNAISIEGWIYGKYNETTNAYTTVVSNKDFANALIKYQYAIWNSTTAKWSEWTDWADPAGFNAGSYKIRAIIVGTDNYNQVVSEESFTVDKAPVYITDLEGNDLPETITKVFTNEVFTAPAYKASYNVSVTVTISSEIKNVGTYTITYSFDGTGTNYLSATETIKVTIQEATIVISNVSVAPWAYKPEAVNTPIATIAQEYARGTEYFQYSTDGGATWKNWTENLESLKALAAGTYKVRAVVPADADNYKETISAAFDFVVNKATTTITGAQDEDVLESKTYRESGYQVSDLVTLGAGHGGTANFGYTFKMKDTVTGKYDIPASGILHAGDYEIVIELKESDNYLGTSITVYVSISKETEDDSGIVVDESKVVYGKPVLEAITLPESAHGTWSITGVDATTKFEAVGSQTFTAVFEPDEDHKDDYDTKTVKINVVVAQAPTSITVDGTYSDKSYNGQPISIFGATVSNGENSEIVITVNGVEVEAGDQFKNVGEYEIKYTYAGNTNYTGATVTFTVEITKADVTIDLTIDDKWTYNTPAGEPSATFNELFAQEYDGEIDFKYYYDEDCTREITATADKTLAEILNTLDVGTYYVKAVFESNDNLKEASAVKSFEIEKATIAVPEYEGEYRFTGKDIPVVFPNGTSTLYTITGNVAKDGVKDYTMVLDLGTNFKNYDWVDEEGNIVSFNAQRIELGYKVVPATVTLENLSTGWTYGAYNNKQPTVTIKLDGKDITELGITIRVKEFRYYTNEACTDEYKFTPANETSANQAGEYYWVVAVVEGTKNFAEATLKARFTVEKATPTIQGIEDKTYGKVYDGTAYVFPLDIKGSYAGAPAVTYETIINYGEYTVSITLPESDNYKSVTVTGVKVSITKATNTQTITVANAGDIVFGKLILNNIIKLPADVQGTWKLRYNTVDGAEVAADDTFKDIGDFTFWAVFTPDQTGNYAERSVEITVNVGKAPVDAPIIDRITYDEQPHDSGIQDKEGYANAQYVIVEDIEHTAAGSYRVILRLKDVSKYKWNLQGNANAYLSDANGVEVADTNAEYITINYRILALNDQDWNAYPDITEKWQYQQADNPARPYGYAEARHGGVEIYYKPFNEDDSAFSTTRPTTPGKYVARFVTTDTNYEILTVDKPFEITAREITPPEWNNPSFSYRGGTENITSGLTNGFGYEIISDVGGITVGSSYFAEAELTDEYYVWADTETNENRKFYYSIVQTQIVIDGLGVGGWVYDPNKTIVTPSYTLSNVHDNDKAGVKVTFKYYKQDGTYLGDDIIPTTTGWYYVVATATPIDNDNLLTSVATKSDLFEITKAPTNITGASDGQVFTESYRESGYAALSNGISDIFTLGATHDEDKIFDIVITKGGVGATIVGVGDYNVAITLRASDNYQSKTINVTVRINPATVPFDENLKTQTATYNQPISVINLPESEFGYWSIQETTLGNVGVKKEFTAIFTSTSPNHAHNTEGVKIYVTVNPADITFTGDSDREEFFKNGAFNVSTLVSATSGVTPSYTIQKWNAEDEVYEDFDGEIKDAGKYLVTYAFAATTNYNGGETDIVFTVKSAVITFATNSLAITAWQYKGYNAATNASTITVLMNGKELSNFNGVTIPVVFHYYRDAACSDKITDSTVEGYQTILNELPVKTYYVKAEVVATANYDGKISGAAPFTLTKASTSITVTGEPNEGDYIINETYDGDEVNAPSGTVSNGVVLTPTVEKLNGEGKYVSHTDDIVDAGTYRITYAYTGDGNYEAAATKIVTITISPATVEFEDDLAVGGNSSAAIDWTFGQITQLPTITTQSFAQGEVYYQYQYKDPTTGEWSQWITWKMAQDVSTIADNDVLEGIPANAGQYRLRAVVDETANYYGAKTTPDGEQEEQVYFTFIIKKAPVTIVPSIDNTERDYNGAAITVPAPSVKNSVGDTLGFNVTLTITRKDGDTVTTVATLTNAGYNQLIDVGEYTLTYTVDVGTNTNYTSEGATKTITVTIKQATVSIATPSTENWTYGTNAKEASGATFNQEFAKNYNSAIQLVYYRDQACTDKIAIPEGKTVLDVLGDLDAETYYVRAEFAGNNNLKAVNSTVNSFTVEKAQTIINNTVNSQEKFYDSDEIIIPAPSTNSGEQVTLTIIDKNGNEVAKVINTGASLVNVGEYTLTYTVAESTNYLSKEVVVNVTIKAATIDITGITINGWTYGEYDGRDPVATGTIPDFAKSLIKYWFSTDGSVWTEWPDTTNSKAFAANSYYVKASIAADTSGYANYNGDEFATTETAFTVAKANASITATSKINDSTVSNGSTISMEYRPSGYSINDILKNVTASHSEKSLVYTVDGAIAAVDVITFTDVIVEGEGVYTLVISLAESDNYKAVELTVKVKITPADNEDSFETEYNATFGDNLWTTVTKVNTLPAGWSIQTANGGETHDTTTVGDFGTNTFYLVFDHGINYNSRDAIEIAVIVGKKQASISVSTTINGETVSVSDGQTINVDYKLGGYTIGELFTITASHNESVTTSYLLNNAGANIDSRITNVNTHTVKISITESANYSAAEFTVKVKINPIDAPSLGQDASNNVSYEATYGDSFWTIIGGELPDGWSIDNAPALGATVGNVGAHTFTAVFDNKSGNYNEQADVTITINVEAKPVTIQGADTENAYTQSYKGSEYTLEQIKNLINASATGLGEDSLDLSYAFKVADTTALNADEYKVIISLDSSETNYKAEPVEVTFKITKVTTIDITGITINGWTYGEYDGRDPVATGTIPDFATSLIEYYYQYSVNGTTWGEWTSWPSTTTDTKAFAAGYYKLKAVIADGGNNYNGDTFVTEEAAFTVAKANASITATSKINDNTVSNGSTISMEYRPSGYSINDILKNVTASHSEKSLVYTVDGAIAAVDVITFTDVIVEGEGVYTLVISLAESDNYKAVELTVKVKITPATNTDSITEVYNNVPYNSKLWATIGDLPSGWSIKDMNGNATTADTTVGDINAEGNQFLLVFHDDMGNYNDRTVPITIFVTKADNEIIVMNGNNKMTSGTPIELTYNGTAGYAFANLFSVSAKYTDGNEPTFKYSFMDQDADVSSIQFTNVASYEVLITLEATTHYNQASFSVKVDIVRADGPVFTDKSVEITYGQTLADVYNTLGIPEGWTIQNYESVKSKVLNVSDNNTANNQFVVVFNNGTNYKPQNPVTISVIVNPANGELKNGENVMADETDLGKKSYTSNGYDIGALLPNLGWNHAESASISAAFYKKNAQGVYELLQNATKISDVGDYMIEISLAESTNYDGDSALVYVEIIKANVTFVKDDFSITGWEYGQYNATTNKASVTATVNGNEIDEKEITFKYYTDGAGTNEITTALNALPVGTYYVRAVVNQTNYAGTSDVLGQVSITAHVVKLPFNRPANADAITQSFVYDGSVQHLTIPTSDYYTIEWDSKDANGNPTSKNAAIYTVKLTLKPNCVWSDNKSTDPVIYKYEITKADAVITIDSTKLNVNGIVQTPYTGSEIDPADFATTNVGTLTWTITKGDAAVDIIKDVGKYDITYTVAADPNGNYNAATSRTITVDIGRANPEFWYVDGDTSKKAEDFFTSTAKFYQNMLGDEVKKLVAKNASGEVVDGTFTFTSSFSATAGGSTITVTFTPDNQTNYAPTTVPYNITLVAVAKLNSIYYGTIEKAVEVANAAGSGIVWVCPFDADLAAKKQYPTITGDANGNLIINSGVTLRLPYGISGDGTNNYSDISKLITDYGSVSPAGEELCHVKVVIANGVTVTNNGTIDVAGHIKSGTSGSPYSSVTAGEHARLELDTNATIVNNGTIYAAGFIREVKGSTGSQIIMNSGSKLYQPYTVCDFKGGSITSNIYTSYSDVNMTPFNLFLIMNVSPEVVYKYGSELKIWASLAANSGLGTTANNTEATFIGGTGAVIQWTEAGAYISAKYYPDNEVMDLHFYGGVKTNALSMKVSGIDISTAGAFFPLTYHHRVMLHKLDDQTEATYTMDQLFKLMPNSVFVVDEGVHVTVKTFVVYEEADDLTSGFFTGCTGCGYTHVAGLYPASETLGTLPDFGDYAINSGTGKLIVNGRMTVTNKFAGKVYSQSDGAIIHINGEIEHTAVEAHAYTVSGSLIKTYNLVNNNEFHLKATLMNGNGTTPITPTAGTTYTYSNGAWKQPVVYIGFNANGGNGVGTIGVPFEDGIYQGLPTPTREHYTFVCWKDAEGNIIENGVALPAECAAGSTLTLTAEWELTEYTLRYQGVDKDGNPIAWEKDELKFKLGDFYSLPTITPPDGYTHLGWRFGGKAITSLTIDECLAAVKETDDGIITVQVVFESIDNTYTYIFNLGDAYPGLGYPNQTWSLGTYPNSTDHSELMNQITGAVAGVDYETSPNHPFYFEGWYTDADFKTRYTKDYQPTEAEKTSKTITLYAKWEEKVSITYTTDNQDANGNPIYPGLITNGDTLLTYGTKYWFKPDSIMLANVKENDSNTGLQYYFKGWTLNGAALDESYVGKSYSQLKKDQDNVIHITWGTKGAVKVSYYDGNIVIGDISVGRKTGNSKGTGTYYLKPGNVVIKYQEWAQTFEVIFTYSTNNQDPGANGTSVEELSGNTKDSNSKVWSCTINLTEGSVYWFYADSNPDPDEGGDSCLAAGTLITLADGSKKAVEDLRKGDLVMSFDHLTGQITYREVIIVVKTSADLYYKNTFVFSDGTELVTINEHGIFDLDLNKYVNIDHLNYEEYIGHRFVSVDTNGNLGIKTLVDVTTVCESGYKYDIVTNGTLNYVAEDTLSVTHVLVDIINTFDFGDNLMYDQEKMMADIETYGLYTYDEWEEYCDVSVFDEYNIPVMHIGVCKGLYTKEYIIGLINTYVLDDSVQIID